MWLGIPLPHWTSSGPSPRRHGFAHRRRACSYYCRTSLRPRRWPPHHPSLRALIHSPLCCYSWSPGCRLDRFARPLEVNSSSGPWRDGSSRGPWAPHSCLGLPLVPPLPLLPVAEIPLGCSGCRGRLARTESTSWCLRRGAGCFVSIYGGFNSPDATDFLISSVCATVHCSVAGCRGKRMSRTNAWTNQATPRPQITRTTPHATAAPAAQDRVLRKTEEAYLDVADNMVGEFPKLALMGCCVIAMLMKGDGMYFMNVGHNHAVLGTMDSADLQQISVGSFHGLVGDCSRCLSAVQITGEHSTSVQEEVYRIRNDHPDDPLQSPRITLRNP